MDNRPLRVLYLEDSPADADLARRALARRAPHIGLEIVTSVADALARLAEDASTWDLALCDLCLPDGSGLEVLAAVRERELPIAVAILTSSGDPGTAIAALRAGADDYIVKRGDYQVHLAQTLPAAIARFRSAQARQARTLRVLYAEHNPFDHELARIHFARHARHIRLDFVASGEALLERMPVNAATTPACDVVLLDLRLPGADGLTIAKVLRDERGLDVPIVLATSQDSEETVAMALRLGISDFVVKRDGYLDALPATLERAFQQAELRRRAAALRTAGSRMAQLLAASPVVLYALRVEPHPDGFRLKPEWVSENMTRVFGHTPEACLQPGWWHINVHPDDADHARRDIDDLFTRGALAHEYRFHDGNGAVRWVRDEMRVVHGPDGEPVQIVGSWSDMTVQRRSEERLRLDAAALAATRDGVLITDLDGTIRAVNPAFSEITGYAEAEVLGHNPRLLASGRQNESFYRSMWRAIQGEGGWQGEIWNRRKSGEIYPQFLTVSTVRNASGEATHYVGVSTDLTRLRKSEAELEHLAHHDPLTGLPNRLLLQSRLQHGLDRAARHGHRVALLVLNIDEFKTVIESLGHGVADELLKSVAHRLDGRLRAEDTLARTAGDEFALVVEAVTDPLQAETVARNLLEAMEAPFALADGHEAYVRASIGIALYPDEGRDVGELLRQAGTAMHRAKAQGGQQIAFYTRELNAGAIERLELDAALRNALARRELVLHYQPKVDLASGRVVGAEALLRWQHPEQGLVPPARFVPAAERSGLIVPIGAHVIDEACRQLAAWRTDGLHELGVAVNVSARQFSHGDLEAVVRAALERHGVEPGRLELELTESMLMEAPERAIERLNALKRIGVRLSLDDFGTGYSSLGYLSRFPVDHLKIDRSFVEGLASEPDSAAIATSVIALAHRMGLTVIAEGVETEAQLAYLRRHGCDEMQGYYFSRPLPADGFVALLRAGRELPSRAEPDGMRTLLLVDDEPGVLGAIRRSLRGERYRLLEARDADEGLALLAIHEVQVILSDQRMPGMSGTEFFQRVKALHPETVRIVLSGHAELDAIIEAVNAGAIHKFLTKPWDDLRLREHVREAFRYHEAVIRPRSRST